MWLTWMSGTLNMQRVCFHIRLYVLKVLSGFLKDVWLCKWQSGRGLSAFSPEGEKGCLKVQQILLHIVNAAVSSSDCCCRNMRLVFSHVFTLWMKVKPQPVIIVRWFRFAHPFKNFSVIVKTVVNFDSFMQQTSAHIHSFAQSAVTLVNDASAVLNYNCGEAVSWLDVKQPDTCSVFPFCACDLIQSSKYQLIHMQIWGMKK